MKKYPSSRTPKSRHRKQSCTMHASDKTAMPPPGTGSSASASSQEKNADPTPGRQAHLDEYFGGQRAPLSSCGGGREILYRCPACHHPWLQNVRQVRLRLLPEEVQSHARRLGADLQRLPHATCRICSLSADTGTFEIEEYGEGKGYGLNWEAAGPPGAHLQLSVISGQFLATGQIIPDIVRAPHKAREVLRWLAKVQALPCIGVITEEMSAQLAVSNPPGHGASGTGNWRWRGGIFSLWCPPLEDETLVTLAMALPPEEPVDLLAIISLCQQLGAIAAEGGITGETKGKSSPS